MSIIIFLSQRQIGCFAKFLKFRYLLNVNFGGQIFKIIGETPTKCLKGVRFSTMLRKTSILYLVLAVQPSSEYHVNLLIVASESWKTGNFVLLPNTLSSVSRRFLWMGHLYVKCDVRETSITASVCKIYKIFVMHNFLQAGGWKKQSKCVHWNF